MHLHSSIGDTFKLPLRKNKALKRWILLVRIFRGKFKIILEPDA